MNLTRALEVALPEIPARDLANRVPRLAPDVVFKEHIEDGKPVVRVLVPSQEAMFTFPLQNWTLAQLFDGVRSYDQIAELYSAEIGTQYDADEVREFAATMEEAGFWHKTAQDKNILLMQKDAQKRRKELKAKKSKYGDLAQIAFPAVNPDKFLTWLHRYTSWIYTWWFTLVTLLAFAIMAAITLAHWSEIGQDTLHFFNFKEKTWGDVGLFYLVAVGAMCWHEIGHGHATKHYGGRVPAMGFLLIYLTPAFYTDTAEGQVLASRHQRMIIALAGAWAELYICTVATVLWWASSPNTTIHSVAYMMMLITGIASVLINFNPLMKLDGYYVMSEILGLVDLKENSTAYTAAWVKAHIWGLPVDVPYVPRRRRLGYAVYALLSGLYSYTVLYVVARLVGNIFRNFEAEWAFVPQLGTAAFIFRSRIRKLVNFMKLVYLDKRERMRDWLGSRPALFLTAGICAILLVPLWRESLQGQFLLESSNRAVVRAMVPGTVQRVFATEGQTVEAGQPLVSLTSLPLQAKLSKSRADYTLASMLATDAELRYSGYGTALQERQRFAEQAHYVTQELASLKLNSPVSGVVMTPGLQDRVASYVSAGTVLAEVADLREMRARIFVSEHDMHRLKVGAAARLYVNGFLRTWDTTVLAIGPKSTEIDAALEEEREFQGLRPPNFYVAEMRISNPDLVLKPGMVGFARIYGQRKSVAGLLWREVWQFVQRKIW
jgi:putative peptide zinc metalloprotease protein